MRVHVVANRVDREAGFLGDALVARGAELVRVWRDEPGTFPDPTDADLVLALGSDWSVYWDHVGEAVEREAAFLRRALEADLPVLAVCYGAQLLAHALGGRVEAAPAPEIGWFEVETDRPEVVPEGPWLQWHVDRFTVPPGAVELARSPVGPQAYALGSAVALQFHPEADPAMVGRWAREGADWVRGHGGEPVTLAEQSVTEAAPARLRAEALLDDFLAGRLAP